MAVIEDEERKKELQTRLRTIKGHLEGVEQMLEEEKDCKELLIQLSAIKSSINKVGLSLLESDACECIIDSIEDEEEIDQVVKEALDTVLKFTR
ncbi:metal-sensitive transcriptional regulator [Halanaerobaculum tunisiense]